MSINNIVNVPLGEINILLVLLGVVLGGGVGGYGYYRLLSGVQNIASYLYLLGGILSGSALWGLGLGLFWRG